jgi:hypothetical protein
VRIEGRVGASLVRDPSPGGDRGRVYNSVTIPRWPMVRRPASIPQAWAEGLLAYRRGASRRACPYLEGSDAAQLWNAGWALGFVRDAGPPGESAHRWRHVLDKHIPDRDAWPSRGWRP